MKKNRECSWRRLNLDIGEKPQVPANATWPCATVVVGEYSRKSLSIKKNRECSSTRLNLDIGERRQVPGYATAS